ncbi:MAG: LacI family DNA-binding transcriptional regulator [Opitutales bacterium]|nr:LacI family DNA-binding transcriptional regulator [Opitutales bacterium]
MREPTLKEIARCVGVSVNTVSLALRESPRVSEKTRRRVKEAAARTGYRPNPYVSALMSAVRRNRRAPPAATLAFLGEHELSYCQRVHPYIYRFFAGARARAEEQGYGVDFLAVGDRPYGRGRLSDILYSRGIQGVLSTWINPELPSLDLEWSRFASVVIGLGETTAPVDRVENDQLHSADETVERLIAAGHRRIGMVFGWKNAHRPLFERYSMAFRQALFRHGRPTRDAVYAPEEYSLEGFRRWLERFSPDAVVGIHSQRMKDLVSLGYAVPAQISFACCDLWDADLAAGIAGIRYRYEAVGAHSVDLLTGMIRRNQRGCPELPTLTTLPGEWVDGKTIRARLRAERVR